MAIQVHLNPSPSAFLSQRRCHGASVVRSSRPTPSQARHGRRHRSAGMQGIQGSRKRRPGSSATADVNKGMRAPKQKMETWKSQSYEALPLWMARCQVVSDADKAGADLYQAGAPKLQ